MHHEQKYLEAAEGRTGSSGDVMIKRLHQLGTLLILVSAAVLASGCAAISNWGAPSPQERASEIEPVLSAAGFKMLPADDANKMVHLHTLPQLSVKYYPDQKGNLHYWMADAQFCHCLYLGDDENYQRYMRLRLQQKLAEREHEAAEERIEAAQEEQMDTMDPFAMGFGPVFMLP